MKWSPHQITLLFDIYSGNFRRANPSSNSTKEALEKLYKADLIAMQADPSEYVLTPRGDAFVQKIMEKIRDTPVPVAKTTWEFPE